MGKRVYSHVSPENGLPFRKIGGPVAYDELLVPSMPVTLRCGCVDCLKTRDADIVRLSAIYPWLAQPRKINTDKMDELRNRIRESLK